MSQSGHTNPYEVGHRIFDTMIHNPERKELPDESRGSWYCPCARPYHENLIRFLMEQHDFDRIYDLGAGDLRLSVALADDYDVVAYELNTRLAETALQEHQASAVDVRISDYYEDWDEISKENALFAAIGRSNRIPSVPSSGIGVEGAGDLRIVHGESSLWKNTPASAPQQ